MASSFCILPCTAPHPPPPSTHSCRLFYPRRSSPTSQLLSRRRSWRARVWAPTPTCHPVSAPREARHIMSPVALGARCQYLPAIHPVSAHWALGTEGPEGRQQQLLEYKIRGRRHAQAALGWRAISALPFYLYCCPLCPPPQSCTCFLSASC